MHACIQAMNTHLYTVCILWIIGVGGASSGLLKLIYKPMKRFVTHKRRTIQHSPDNTELRLMVCAHHPENIPPLVALLETSHLNSPSSPLCIYLLHLVPLIGHSIATLAPYRDKKRRRRSLLISSLSTSSSSTSISDIIVNAFRSLELTLGTSLSIVPFIGMSPFKYMHEDVCSLACDKRIALLVLPFHVHVSNGIEHRNASIQSVNVSILQHAPCSVAILIDHGVLLNGQHVKVFFLGGADDREALAYGARMARNLDVNLTVVRVMLVTDDTKKAREAQRDAKAIEKLKEIVDGERVVYMEEMVHDGVGTVEVLRRICENCMLLIVGRRAREESLLTAGLHDFCDYPELGVVGDMMAMANFGASLSTLVVQQQVRVKKAASRFRGGGHGHDHQDSSEEEEEEKEVRKNNNGEQS